jgi:hypothetical protein
LAQPVWLADNRTMITPRVFFKAITSPEYCRL